MGGNGHAAAAALAQGAATRASTRWSSRPSRRPAPSETNPLYRWLGRLEREKLQQEKRRLLYVAATRAERSLHLLGSCEVIADKKTGELKRARAGAGVGTAACCGSSHRSATSSRARLAESGDIAGEAGHVIPRDPVCCGACRMAGTVPSRRRRRRFSSATLVRATTAAAVEFDWATETARHVGTRGAPRAAATRARGRRACRTTRRDAAPLQRRYVGGTRGTRRAARAAQRGRSKSPGGRSAHARRRTRALAARSRAPDAQSELALTGVVDSDLVSIVIDRTFVDATGVRWIVDYKTSSHEGAGLDAVPRQRA